MIRSLNTNKDAAPLYVQIKEDLKEKIESGHWVPGDKIPSELELCEQYQVSRITVREAINELVWEGYLIRKRAKGTFVLDYKQKLSDRDYYTYVKSFTYEMKELGKSPVTIKASVKKIKADRFLAAQLQIKEGADIIELKRVRGVDGKVFVFFKTYILYDPRLSLSSEDYYGSFYKMLKEIGITIAKVKEYLEAVKPDHEVQEQLNVDEHTPILKRVRHASDQNGAFREYTECFYIGEQYRYYIDFSTQN